MLSSKMTSFLRSGFTDVDVGFVQSNLNIADDTVHVQRNLSHVVPMLRISPRFSLEKEEMPGSVDLNAILSFMLF
jgi:hypothetical protein